MQILIDEVDNEGAIGRTIADAPEIDGMVYLNGENGLERVSSSLVKLSTQMNTTFGQA